MSVLQSAIPDPERQMAYPLNLWLQQDFLTSQEISAFHISLLPRKQSLCSFFQMVTLSYPEESPHNTLILDVGWWAGLKT